MEGSGHELICDVIPALVWRGGGKSHKSHSRYSVQVSRFECRTSRILGGNANHSTINGMGHCYWWALEWMTAYENYLCTRWVLRRNVWWLFHVQRPSWPRPCTSPTLPPHGYVGHIHEHSIIVITSTLKMNATCNCVTSATHASWRETEAE
jgi:hypothetical protein